MGELNNQYWKLRDKHGRDKLFATPQSILDEAQGYFQHSDANPWIKKEPIKGGEFCGQCIDVPATLPYTMDGLCTHLRINTKYFYQFKKTCNEKLANKELAEQHDTLNDFIDAIEFVEQAIYTQKFNGAAIGAFKESLIAKELGMVEKTQNELVGKDGQKLDMNPVVKVILSEQTLARSEKDVDV